MSSRSVAVGELAALLERPQVDVTSRRAARCGPRTASVRAGSPVSRLTSHGDQGALVVVELDAGDEADRDVTGTHVGVGDEAPDVVEGGGQLDGVATAGAAARRARARARRARRQDGRADAAGPSSVTSQRPPSASPSSSPPPVGVLGPRRRSAGGSGAGPAPVRGRVVRSRRPAALLEQLFEHGVTELGVSLVDEVQPAPPRSGSASPSGAGDHRGAHTRPPSSPSTSSNAHGSLGQPGREADALQAEHDALGQRSARARTAGPAAAACCARGR